VNVKQACTRTLSSLFLLASSAFVLAQPVPQQITIGEIEFFGYAGIDVNKLRSALPVREDDQLKTTTLAETIERVRQSVVATIHKPSTDVQFTCCDSQNRWIIYIGLPGGSQDFALNPAPHGAVRLPFAALRLYQQTMDAMMNAVSTGKAGEDRSHGYALSVDPELRNHQLALRNFAIHHEDLVFDALDHSADTDSREAAAHILGYANQSPRQIQALVRASCDSDETVRNNAIRALSVLAESSPAIAKTIPAENFISMLNSGSWTDRNKAGFLLFEMTLARPPALLAQLRKQALPALEEMARWRTGHSYFARIILGRVAGMPEPRLQKLSSHQNQVETIIAAAQSAK